MFAVREPLRSGVASANPALRHAFRELRDYRGILVTLVACAAMVGLADGAALIWAAPTLSRSFGLGPDRVGAMLALVLLLSGVLGPILGGIGADLCQRAGGPRRTIALVSGVNFLSVPASLFAIAPSAYFAGGMLGILMTLGGVTAVTLTVVATVVIPNELRGLCFGVFAAVGAVFGAALAPLAVSLLSGATGGPATIGAALAWVCGVSSLIGAVTCAVGARCFPGQAMSADDEV
jgi:MFS family permease